MKLCCVGFTSQKIKTVKLDLAWKLPPLFESVIFVYWNFYIEEKNKKKTFKIKAQKGNVIVCAEKR